MTRMHDWVLVSVLFEWKEGRVTLVFDTYEAGQVSVIAQGVSDLHVSQVKDWGPSVSVNSVKGPLDAANGRQRLEIEMQSGDTIEIEAAAFDLPPAAIANTSPGATGRQQEGH